MPWSITSCLFQMDRTAIISLSFCYLCNQLGATHCHVVTVLARSSTLSTNDLCTCAFACVYCPTGRNLMSSSPQLTFASNCLPPSMAPRRLISPDFRFHKCRPFGWWFDVQKALHAPTTAMQHLCSKFSYPCLLLFQHRHYSVSLFRMPPASGIARCRTQYN